jgi:heterodisulfide reductase subunit A
VNEEVCTGCGTCLTVCPYDAISRDEARGLAMVSEALCTGCGTCAATCPSAAVQQAGFNDLQVRAELDMLLGLEPAVLTRAAEAAATDWLESRGEN